MKLVSLLLAPALASCGLMDSDKRDRRVVARVEEPAVAPTAAPGVPNSPRETDAGRGLPGEKGERGEPGQSIVGLMGPRGEPGQSIVGPQGEPGRDGQSIVGPAGPMGPRGEIGQAGQSITGPQGVPGESAFLTAYVIHAAAQRTYNPSTFTNDETVAPAGIYDVPQSLLLTVGAAGTGWARLQLGNYAFCYQGNAGNNGHPGTAFVLKGVVLASILCESNSPKQPHAGAFILASNGVFKLSVPGGGISSNLQTFPTHIHADVPVTPFNF